MADIMSMLKHETFQPGQKLASIGVSALPIVPLAGGGHGGWWMVATHTHIHTQHTSTLLSPPLVCACVLSLRSSS